jgi:hypothetical protein
MSNPRTRAPRSLAVRAAYQRTPNSFLVNDPDGFPSDFPPIWWTGYDSGGGAYPIGPNGPYPQSVAATPAVIRATALITGPLTAAPFRVLDQAAVGEIVRAPRWLTDPTNLRDLGYGGIQLAADVEQRGRGDFWAEWIRAAIWYGLGAFVYQPGADSTDVFGRPNGEPIAGTLRVVHPMLVATEHDNDGRLCWAVGDTRFDADGYYRAGAAWFRVIVLRNPHSPVDAEGMSQGVFAMSPTTFGLARQIESYASGTFRSGVPAGYLKVTQPGLTRDVATDLRQRWLASHGGDRRSIAVLNSTTEFHALSLSPVDAALDQVKRLNVADVAFAFGLDPMTLGAGLNNSATYSNLRDAWANHKDFGLALWISAVQDTLSALLPGSTAATVNLDGFANPPASERFASYKVALDAGILTVNEEPPPVPVPPEDAP